MDILNTALLRYNVAFRFSLYVKCVHVYSWDCNSHCVPLCASCWEGLPITCPSLHHWWLLWYCACSCRISLPSQGGIKHSVPNVAMSLSVHKANNVYLKCATPQAYLSMLFARFYDWKLYVGFRASDLLRYSTYIDISWIFRVTFCFTVYPQEQQFFFVGH